MLRSIPALGGAAFLLATALSGCAGEEPAPPPGSFPALHYGYLPPIRLNVATIDVENDAPPSPLAARSPVTPADALADMAHDRLVAAGPTGTAVFTVTDASIRRGDDGLTAHLAAHLDIVGAGGAKQGYAEATVTRNASGDTEDAVGPASLYALTRAAMQDMNVEFEFQVRHNLADWLVTPGATEETPVNATPLAPDAGNPAAPAPGAPLSLAPAGEAAAPPAGGAPVPIAPPLPSPVPAAPVDGVPPQSVQAPGLPAETMSPPPGDLVAPPGAAAATPDLDVPPASTAAPVPVPSGGY